MNTPKEVVIAAYARTPIGCFGGSLSDLTAPELGAAAIQGVLNKVRGRLNASEIDSVLMGHVLTGGCGQSTARQAAIAAGLPVSTPSYSIDKVCASGMKAVTAGAASIMCGSENIVIAGGMESMSRVPFQIDTMRFGKRMGHDRIVDGLIRDGLWDVYNDEHMGSITEKVNVKFNISRQELDEYAAESYKKTLRAYHDGHFDREIVPVVNKKGITVVSDEQLEKVKPEKLSALKPSFRSDGIITAGNASPISDGAAALLLMDRSEAEAKGITPLARILGWADSGRRPEDFTIAPALAVEQVLRNCGLCIEDIELWEFNEAFATVPIANMKLLTGIHSDKVNILGGALSIGHPLGCSGARIICTLLTSMMLKGVKYGCAAICNGGGQASAIILKLDS